MVFQLAVGTHAGFEITPGDPRRMKELAELCEHRGLENRPVDPEGRKSLADVRDRAERPPRITLEEASHLLDRIELGASRSPARDRDQRAEPFRSQLADGALGDPLENAPQLENGPRVRCSGQLTGPLWTPVLRCLARRGHGPTQGASP